MIADKNNLGRFLGNRYFGIVDLTQHNGHSFVAYDLYKDMMQEPLIEYDPIEKFPSEVLASLKPGSNFIVEVHESGLKFGMCIGEMPQSRLNLLRARGIEVKVDYNSLHVADVSGDMRKEMVTKSGD